MLSIHCMVAYLREVFYIFARMISYLLLLGFLNCCDLLGDDRQHFNIDTIELIKTRPRTGTR